MLFKGKRTPDQYDFYSRGFGFYSRVQDMTGYAPVLDSIYLFFFGFFIFGPQMLIGLACAELAHKKAAATANGFAGCFGYLGAAAAGGPLGAVTKIWGWESFFLDDDRLFGFGHHLHVAALVSQDQPDSGKSLVLCQQ